MLDTETPIVLEPSRILTYLRKNPCYRAGNWRLNRNHEGVWLTGPNGRDLCMFDFDEAGMKLAFDRINYELNREAA